MSEECDEAGGQVRLSTKLVNIDRDLLMIPNLAIHMNRKANDGIAFNVQNDMLPLFSQTGSKGEFMELVADSAGVCKDNIVGSDLFCIAGRSRLSGERRTSSSQLRTSMICSAFTLLCRSSS